MDMLDGRTVQAARGYRLDTSGDPLGVSCGPDGPCLGPLRLLDKAGTMLRPRPLHILDRLFSETFDQPVDCSELLLRLAGIADALNRGELARAMVGTQLLRLPVLSKEQAERAAVAEAALSKASPDDPIRPGWRAGTPGGKGGKFRPKTPEEIGDYKANLKRQIIRRAIRKGVAEILSWKRLARLGAEAVGDAIPGVDVVSAAMTGEDLAQMASEFEELVTETRVALDFADKAPYSLDKLQVDSEAQGFSNMKAFAKDEAAKRYNSAGTGNEYHHIVEQGGDGARHPPEMLHSTKNIVRLPKLVHEEVSAEAGRPQTEADASTTIRESLKGKSWDEKYESGLEILRRIGAII
ncbi:MAG TPA: hypothetical protein VL574_09030 [Stellaceae bacterium]|nr:hypothetical protein [Stellaceae bacterium]